MVQKNRSYRRFDESSAVVRSTLEGFVENARHSASTANLQPLKYFPVDSAGPRAAVFECLKWAGYLTEWVGPESGERPAAYLVMVHDTEIKIKAEYLWFDAGLASQTILLSATEAGLGGCILASIDRDRLRSALSIPSRYEILVVLALGKPVEKVVLTEVTESGSIKYFRDTDGVHYVPKRSIAEILIG
ncbi:MAG TPA: nitroreductase family protein [Spirochaetia bacterium]|nr:nitroreductase family protein [Spirochaetia bacterium]